MNETSPIRQRPGDPVRGVLPGTEPLKCAVSSRECTDVRPAVI
ncbi:hypothetical protein YT1_4474 [Rhodococcus ruber]|nr:hypothetical protein YT1_4474 [Rhodococcus ruber]